MSIAAEKTSDQHQDTSQQTMLLALAIAAGIVVFALLGRSGQVQTSSPEFVARDYYDR